MRAASGRKITNQQDLNNVHDVMEVWLALHHILVEGDNRGWNVCDTSESDKSGHFWERQLVGTFAKPEAAYRAALEAVSKPNSEEIGQDIRKAWDPATYERFKNLSGKDEKDD